MLERKENGRSDPGGVAGRGGRQGAQDSIESGPASGGLAAAAVDDQLGRIFGDVRVEVIQQHAHGGLLLPPFARNVATARGTYGSRMLSNCRRSCGHDKFRIFPG